MEGQKTHAEVRNALGIEKAFDVYKVTREYIQHEDGLVNQRMTWFISLNSFLFLALGPIFAAIVTLLQRTCFGDFGSSGEFNVICRAPLINTYENHILVFLLMYGLVGSLTAIITYHSVNAAYSAIDALEDFWRLSYEVTIYGGPPSSTQSIGKPHRAHDDDKVAYEKPRRFWIFGSRVRKRPYDRAVVLPYITGGGPERQSKSKGKWIPRFLLGSIGAFWLFLSGVCVSSLLGLIEIF